MCEQKQNATRFRHHFLDNGAILTVATCLEYATRNVRVGWAIFNPADKRWVRKLGTYLARNRMDDHPLFFNLTENEPILCDYISLRALLVILGSCVKNKPVPEAVAQEHPTSIPKKTLKAIVMECDYITSLLADRLGLGRVYV